MNVRELLDAEKLKHCFECGICTASCSMMELMGDYYNPRVLLEKICLNPQEALTSDALWLCAWCYRCHKRCPQALKLPEIFQTIRKAAADQGYTKSFEEALRKIAANVPLPFVATLLCFHPERAGLDSQKVLEELEKIVEENRGARKRRKISKKITLKVAIIGSGPSGLTVAHELARRGYGATMFETLPKGGGMLRKCIPEYRLPKDVLDKEIQTLKDSGVDLKTGVTFGKDMNLDDLWKKGYKAVFIGTGSQKSLNPKIEGADLKGAIDALEFLWCTNRGQDTNIGKKVIVIGGGNVAIDAARTSLSCGAKETTIAYRRSREEMPANPWEAKEAEDDGVKLEFLVAPKRIVGENGKVSAIEFIRMQLGEPDESGRRKPVPIENSEFTKQVDTVIFAIGETVESELLPRNMELNEDNTIWVNPVTMETSIEGVFAGGDAVAGPATVIEAICTGKNAAASIENYLKFLEK
jgi:heterodisulfide reductase subunit A